MEKDLVFITSGGRTGTRTLGDEISSMIPGSHSEHEPDLLDVGDIRSLGRIWRLGLWNTAIGKLVGRRGIRTIGTLRAKGRISIDESVRRIAASRRQYHESISNALVIESNAQWHIAIEEIFRIWPSARVAIIIRDPRSWIRSWLNKGSRWTWSDLPRWLPPGRPTPHSVDDVEAANLWADLDPFGRLAWEWRFIYTTLDEAVSRNPNASIFRFENLFDENDSSSMERLIRFCAKHENRSYGVNISTNLQKTKKNSSQGDESDWRTWSSLRCRIVDKLCGRLMEKYGYGHEEEWSSKLSQS